MESLCGHPDLSSTHQKRVCDLLYTQLILTVPCKSIHTLGIYPILLHYNLKFKYILFGYLVMDIHKIVQISEVK